MKRALLFPISLLYGLAIRIRNFLFNAGIFGSRSFDIPIIGIGNLSTGGNGKTPMAEYLIRLLKDQYRVVVLSRGYGRKTRGYYEVKPGESYLKSGDEPAQISTKFPDIKVFVCERRVRGIKNILKKHPETEVILLDDAFQHRWVKPGLSFLLSDYYHPFTRDWLLPAGNLREHRKNVKRADSIIITKSPKVLSPYTIQGILADIKPKEHQHLFFNFIQYTGLKSFRQNEKEVIKKKFTNILLFTGVANPYHLEEYLGDRCSTLDSIHFPDHHDFRAKDIDKIIDHFHSIISKNKIIVTTEKDIMRLKSLDLHEKLKGIPLYYLEMEFEFHPMPDNNFDEYIRDYVRKSKANH
jgi:tetraacyldisaccharide 4'-kinase